MVCFADTHPKMTPSLESRFASVSVKAVVIAALTLLMSWPLSRVERRGLPCSPGTESSVPR